ncbi:hypothetical protein QZH41_017903 [Actinostola sp. cb2023]|nr:hypothetical protein QZH41_017903 [Actinostola sp. cb2023]
MNKTVTKPTMHYVTYLQMAYQVYQVVLQSRPGKTNAPKDENFAYVKAQPLECKEGEVLVKTLYLSVDPYMRGRMNDPTGSSYLPPWTLGEAANGHGVGVVVESKCEGIAKGDIVQPSNLGLWSWQNYVVFTTALQKVTTQESQGKTRNSIFTLYCLFEHPYLKEHPSSVLGLCGVTGLTSLVGLQVKAHITPGANQTVVVSGAAGACGVAAGQIAKLLGSGKVVGICGTDEKCQYLLQDLGFDGAINYKTTTSMSSALQGYCPQGVDVYFDNVGGTISEEVIKLMNKDSHIVLCGQISQYNKDVPYPTPLTPEVQEIATKQNITRDRFLILNYKDKLPAALQQLVQWTQEGKLKSRETVAVGLENIGKAFVSMMSGGNIGKQVIKVSDL